MRQQREGWADCIFLDCKKAFDAVLYIKPRQKLGKQAGITEIILWWIKEYLRKSATVWEDMSD